MDLPKRYFAIEALHGFAVSFLAAFDEIINIDQHLALGYVSV